MAEQHVLRQFVGDTGADGKDVPGLLTLAYDRLAESRGLAATRVCTLFAVSFFCTFARECFLVHVVLLTSASSELYHF